MIAYMTGKVKISGDINAAMELQKLIPDDVSGSRSTLVDRARCGGDRHRAVLGLALDRPRCAG